MERFVILILCLFLINCKNDKKKGFEKIEKHSNSELKDYIDFKYDKIVAFASVKPMDYYDYNPEEEINVNRFQDTISKTLNEKQIIHLNNILSGRENKNTGITSVADCFYPRHNILFLHKDKIVNQIAVCFECSDVKSSNPTLASMENFESFFNSLGLKVFYSPMAHSNYYDSLKLVNKNRIK